MSITTARPRVLSGIQPSGHLHIGSYLGALRGWVADQTRYENYFCIVDLHAITVTQDPEQLRALVLELAAVYLACGIDPAQSEIFVQSHVAAHSQLGWIIQCFTPMGWLERMTQFKHKSATAGTEQERVSAGLLTYPTLMAADILLYDADFVPVGEDQRQHVELCRDVAQRMNNKFGDIFKIPQSLTPPAGARVMGLDDPTNKMSKSLGMQSPGHAVYLLDPPDVARRKIMRAKTDTNPAVSPPVAAGVDNLIDIYAACAGLTPEAALTEFTGKGYGVLKKAVANIVISTVLEPLQARFNVYANDPQQLDAMLLESAGRVTATAEATLLRVQRAVGLR